MKRLSTVIVLAISMVALVGCGPDPGTQLPDWPTPAEVTDLIASLEDSESASLDLVSMTDSQGGSVDAGTHEDQLLQAGYERADIGARERVNGVETELVVPMWYGPETTIRIEGRDPEPMLESVATTPAPMGPVYWFGDHVVSIEFHMEAGVLVLDNVVVPTTP